MNVIAKNLTDKQVMGWQFYFGDKLKGRISEISSFKTFVIKARSESSSLIRLTLMTSDAFAFSTDIKTGSQWTEIRIPLTSLRIDSMMLLPRPYPGFLPLWFKAAGEANFRIEDAEKLQLICIGEGKAAGLEIASIYLEK